MKANQAKTDLRKSPRNNNKVSPTRTSPKNISGKVSPTNRQKVGSPKGSPKANVGQFNSVPSRTPGSASGSRSAYNSTSSAKKKTDGANKSNNQDKMNANKSWDNSVKIRQNTHSTNNSQQQSHRIKQCHASQSQKTTTTAKSKAGTKGAPVTAKNYLKKGTGIANNTKKAPAKTSSFQQNVSKKIQGLKDLQIETYDAVKGRPSMMDVDNKQVFEGNYLPSSLQHLSDQYVQNIDIINQNPSQYNTNSAYASNPTAQVNVQEMASQLENMTLTNAGNGSSQIQMQRSDSNQFQNQAYNSSSSQGMKFKKKSQIEQTHLNKILENKARISINSQTGKHEFKYCQKSTSNIRNSNFDGQGYWQNSDGLVNYINDQNGGPLDQMAPIRPSNLIWQLPFEERKSYLNQQSDFQFNRMSKMNPTSQFFSGNAKASDANAASGAALGVDKQDSVGFVQASGSDSEFEHIDDYIDEAEEFNGASRAVKLSIRALNFNMMLAEKQSQQDPNSHRKVSLLSRASNLVQNQNKQENQKNGTYAQKNFDRSSKLLNLYLKQQNTSQGRDSNQFMSGIDERDEFDEYSHTDSVHSNMLSKGAHSKNASSRGSTLRNQYNFPKTFFTPNQSAKKIQLDQDNQKFSGTTTGQGKQIKFFTAGGQRYPITNHNSQRSYLERSAISEKDNEESQNIESEISHSDYQIGQKLHDKYQFVSGKFSEQISMMQESHQDEPEDPEADVIDDDDETGDRQAADEGYSNSFIENDDQDPRYVLGRNSRPSAQLQLSSQFTEEVANENEQQTQNTFDRQQPGGILLDDYNEKEAFQQTQKVNQHTIESHRLRQMKQIQSQAVSANRRPQQQIDEHTEQRFIPETGNSLQTSMMGANGQIIDGQGAYALRSNIAEHESSNSLLVVEQDSNEFANNMDHLKFQHARIQNLEDKNIDSYVDNSIQYYHNEGQQVLDSGPTQRSGAIVDKHIQQMPGQDQYVSLESENLGTTDRSDPNLNTSFQNEDVAAANNNNGSQMQVHGFGNRSNGSAMTNNQLQLQQTAQFRNTSNSRDTMQHSGVQSTGYPFVDRLRTTERNPLTMSETTNIEKSDGNVISGMPTVQTQEAIPDQAQTQAEESHIAQSYDQPQQFNQNQQQHSGNPLNQLVTKVPQMDAPEQEDGQNNQQNLHQQHFVQTVQALQFIQNNIRVVEEHEMQHMKVQMPPPKFPDTQKKLAIFDMDETLIHCVDDIETQDPDIVLEIDFPDEETVYAGINIRPYIMECLEEANKHFQVIAFTASHQTYADAILDYIDPNREYMTHRLYRQHCFLTEEGYYVKDLRIFAGWDLKDVVIIDNSVYSFAFQIDNGIPIIPFYNDSNDEEMMHLVYYLNCLAKADDVREQNRQAFELFKLSNGRSLDNSQIGVEADPEQFYDDGEEQQNQYYDSNNNNMVDLSNNNPEMLDLQDPAQQPPLQMNSEVPSSYRSQYQVDDVIHEDRLEDFNSYNQSAAHQTRQTEDGYLKHMTQEQYNQLMSNSEQMNNISSNKSSNPSGFKGIGGMDQYTEQTDEESSPVLYNNDGSQIGGHLQQYTNQTINNDPNDFPYTNPSDRLLIGNDMDDALSASHINEENSIILNNQEELLHNQHQFDPNQQHHQTGQQFHGRIDSGNIVDQDDEGGNFYIGSDGENIPQDY